MQLLSSRVSLQNPSLGSTQSTFYSRDSLRNPSFTSKLSRFPTCNNEKNKLSVKCRQSEYFEQQRFSSRPSNDTTFSPKSSSGGASPPRIYVGHSIYKGKAALTVEPRAPEFVPLDSGAFKLSKEGFVLLQFAPAVSVRQYDWSRKQVFSLSVTEMGTIMALGARDSCEFFHDPFKGRSEEGKVRKVLKVEPLPDGSGHFFNLSFLGFYYCTSLTGQALAGFHMETCK